MRQECRECFLWHRLQRKHLVSDPGMHHGTCVTHVSWCMSGSLTRGGGENAQGIPGACATRILTYLARGPLNSYTCIAERCISLIEVETKWLRFCRRYFQCHFLEWKLLYFFSLNFTEICYQRPNWQYTSIGSDDGLAPIKRQNILWTNDGLVYCRIYVSFGLEELICDEAK